MACVASVDPRLPIGRYLTENMNMVVHVGERFPLIEDLAGLVPESSFNDAALASQVMFRLILVVFRPERETEMVYKNPSPSSSTRYASASGLSLRGVGGAVLRVARAIPACPSKRR
jgi:hypothetical protein